MYMYMRRTNSRTHQGISTPLHDMAHDEMEYAVEGCRSEPRLALRIVPVSRHSVVRRAKTRMVGGGHALAYADDPSN